jgi:hypothetical protein
MEADSAREAIDRQGGFAHHLGDSAACDPQEQFQLKGAVLAVAEAHREGAVAGIVGLDQWNSPAVAVDADSAVQPRYAQCPPGEGQPAPQEQAKGESE